MDTLLLIISCLILIFFLKDIISFIIALCILVLCFYYLSGGDYTQIQNIFVSSENENMN